MSEYMDFWWSKFLLELQVSGIIFLVVFMIFITPVLTRKARQYLCKHESYRENMACNAVCTRCGKDLGFIDHIRKMKDRKEG